MSSLLVVGLLFELMMLLIVGAVFAAGIAIVIHFGGVGVAARACPQCGRSSLLPLETARTDGRAPQYQCTNCGASFERALDGSLIAQPTSQQPS